MGEAADQSLVLLKNEDAMLPFDPAVVKRVLVVGRLADATYLMQGNYRGVAPLYVSPCQGMRAHATVTQCLNGTEDGVWNFSAEVSVDRAIAALDDADAVVIVGGDIARWKDTHWNGEIGEGVDRKDLLLTVGQEALIGNLSAAAMKKGLPAALVVMSGGPLDLTSAKANKALSAIIWAGYPGQAGGAAIADAIFGVTNRFGRLTQTWYDNVFAEQVSFTDFGMRPNVTTGNPGRTHRFYTGTPLWAFGDGLTYTSFEQNLSLSSAASPVTDAQPSLSLAYADASRLFQQSASRPHETAAVAKAVVRVQNVGERAGDHVALLFAKPPQAGQNGDPIQVLLGFERVSLEAGETKTLILDVRASALALADIAGTFAVRAGAWKLFLGCSDGPVASAELTLQSENSDTVLA